jgi:single-strand DNA-binding protein
VVSPAQLRGKAMAVVGAPGAGKTITLLRLAYLAGLLGRKVCFVCCKGTDPSPVPALIAAYRLGNPSARIGCWPTTAVDMWRGSPVQVASRLLAVEQFTEPFYQRVASAGLRLALTAPDMPPVDGSDELLRRLDVDELAALWEGRPLQLKDIEAIGDHLPGARLRYADFFAALGGAFDRGHWSYEDVDLAVLTVPTLLSKSEADAAMRVVLEDYGHYATGRKPRQGEDALLILDEFSALASGDSAINLAERVRDVGVQVVVAAQSVEGLGDHRQAPPAAGQLRRRDRGSAVPRPRAAACPGWRGAGAGAQLGVGLLRAPRVRQGPHGGAVKDRPRAGPSGPAGRGLGDPGRPEHPYARAAPPVSASAPVELAATLPLAATPCPSHSPSRCRSGSPPPSPLPGEWCAGWAGESAAGGCLCLAVTARIKDGDTWRDGDTSYIRINVWRQLAEHAADSLSKGDRAVVIGRLKSRSWGTLEGDKRSVVEVEADEVAPSLRWAIAKPQRAATVPRARAASATTSPTSEPPAPVRPGRIGPVPASRTTTPVRRSRSTHHPTPPTPS